MGDAVARTALRHGLLPCGASSIGGCRPTNSEKAPTAMSRRKLEATDRVPSALRYSLHLSAPTEKIYRSMLEPQVAGIASWGVWLGAGPECELFRTVLLYWTWLMARLFFRLR